VAKPVMIIRGPLGVEGSPDITVVQNPTAVSVAQKQDIPTSLNADDLLIKEPGSQKVISLRSLRERIEKREKK